MTIYTDYVELRRLDDWAMHVALQLFLGREFFAWAKQRKWTG